MKNYKKIEKYIDIAFVIAIIIIMGIAAVHIMQKDYSVSLPFVISIGVLFVGIIINLIIKAINLEVAAWKKKILIAAYLAEIILVIYCTAVKDFKWLLAAILLNSFLELLKRKSV